ncbi:MAG: hypothetical protein H6Q38_3131, partial [Chloroflexi bacterium]|nr:hypothetical protein [Chloroflexota bacterium]
MKEKFLFLLIILSLVVAACGGAETETPAPVAPAEVASTTAPTEVMPTEAVLPEPTIAPTETPA